MTQYTQAKKYRNDFFCLSVDMCNFVINEFNQTFEVQNMFDFVPFSGNQDFDDQINHIWQGSLIAQLAKTHKVFHVFLKTSE